MKFKDRTGEENINNFGSKMIITKYIDNKHIDVYFPEYDWTFKDMAYSKFHSGGVKCPYEPRYYGMGYLGEGIFKTTINGIHTIEFADWKSILHRCYSEKSLRKNKSYEDAFVSNEFLCFQNYAQWRSENYYEVPGERMHLDKDILHKGNKVYGRDTCIFVPQRINELFVKQQSKRGKYPIGVRIDKRRNHLYSSIRIIDVNGVPHNKYLGRYETPEEAFYAYKYAKENYIKEVIDSYEGKIPEPFYSKLKTAMYNYKIEIDD